jgi:hypothetical protein
MPIMHQQFCLQFIRSLLHTNLAGILLPVGKVFMQSVLPKKLQFHQTLKKESLTAPIFQRNKSRTFPVEISNSSRADCDVLIPSNSSELYNSQVVRMLSLLQITEFVSKSPFLLHQLDEVFRRQFLLQCFTPLL